MSFVSDNVERHPNFDEDYNFDSWDYDYDFDTMTPLHTAAAKNHNPESIKFLLSLGLDVNAPAEAGNTVLETPLTCAVRNKNNIRIKWSSDDTLGDTSATSLTSQEILFCQHSRPLLCYFVTE